MAHPLLQGKMDLTDLETMTFAKNYYQWIYDEILQYIGKRVGEIGAGTGNFTDYLNNNKQIEKVIAFEPSKNIFYVLQCKYKNNNKVITVNKFFEEVSHKYKEYFDSLIYINVLEHIENDRLALSCAHKSLMKNGYLIIFVPALNFLYSELDRKLGHYRRYTKLDLLKKMKLSGFGIVKAKYFDIIGILPWYVAFVLLKRRITISNVDIYDKMIVPMVKKLEKFCPPPIGKNLIAVGKKV